MSWISKLLGLDNRPTILKALNEAGHTVGTLALEAIPAADLKGRVGTVIDMVTAKAINAVPMIPAEEGGLAKIFLADEMKSAIFAELDRFEPVADPSKSPAEEKAETPAEEKTESSPSLTGAGGGFGFTGEQHT